MSIKTWFMDFLGNVKNEKGEITENIIEEKIQGVSYTNSYISYSECNS